MPICHSLTKTGKKCRNRIAKGKLCYLHKKNRLSTKKKSRKSTKKKSRKSTKKKALGKCKQYFQEKVRQNMYEYKEGRWTSRKQALAVSYSQTRKKKGCSKFGT